MKTGLVIRTLVPLFLASALARPATAQRVPARSPSLTDPRTTLIALENSWATALVRRDARTFERLLAPAFVYTENDQLMTRPQVIASVTGSDTVTEAHNAGMVIHPYAADVAVVTGWLVVSGRNSAGRFVHRYRFTDTWVATDGRWQIVAAQDYLAPAGRR